MAIWRSLVRLIHLLVLFGALALGEPRALAAAGAGLGYLLGSETSDATTVTETSPVETEAVTETATGPTTTVTTTSTETVTETQTVTEPQTVTETVPGR